MTDPFLTPDQFVQLMSTRDKVGMDLTSLVPPTRKGPVAGVIGLPTNADQARALRAALGFAGIGLEPWQSEMLDQLTREPDDGITTETP